MTEEQGTPPPDDAPEADTAQAGREEGCDPVRDRIERALDEAREEIEAFVAEARKDLDGVEARAREEFDRMRQRVADWLEESPPQAEADAPDQGRNDAARGPPLSPGNRGIPPINVR